MTAVRCVVFDIDDTLYLERSYVRSGFRSVSDLLALQGVTGFADVAWELFCDGVRGDVFDRALARLGVRPAPDLVAELVRAYREHEPRISLLPDARRALEAAVSAGPVAVVSDGPLASQRAKARALSLSTWARPVVLTADDCPDEPKPSPRAFQMVEGAVDLRGDACAYVADNPHKDFAGPRALGWLTVRVRRDLSLHAAVDSGQDVDVEVPDLADLPAVLGLTGGCVPSSAGKR